jgi:uncharacterized membrane protein
MKKIIWLIISILAFYSISMPAYAYLDPGTGSIFLQGLFAGFAGLLAVMKIYWGRLKVFISRLGAYFFKKKNRDISNDNEPQKKV